MWVWVWVCIVGDLRRFPASSWHPEQRRLSWEHAPHPRASRRPMEACDRQEKESLAKMNKYEGDPLVSSSPAT